MVSRNIYVQTVLRILCIALSALLAAYFYFGKNYLAFALVIFALALQAYFLIYFVNQTNRKIAYFFDAIKNEDFTLRFPEKLSVKSLEELNHSLNMLNGMIQDIHLKKQAQEQYYQEILRQADIGIFTINDKGHILYANPTVQNLLNYKPLNHVKQLNQVDPNLYGLFKALEPFGNTTYNLRNERGKRELSIKCSPITIEGQSLLLVVVHDIHKELEDKETDSWVKLIRVLTHEIMNTITPITSISESILKYFSQNPMGKAATLNPQQISNTVRGLEVIKDQGTDLMDFVQSYRTFLSVPEPDKTLVPAKKLLEKIGLLATELDKESIAVQMEVDPPDLELFIDEKQITLVLLNLVKNAGQALEGKEEGSILFKAGIDRYGKKFIAIKDNGPGIPPEHLEQIFVPFFTTKKSGSGIGLSLSKQIMRKHRGSIRAISQPGKTVFALTFDV